MRLFSCTMSRKIPFCFILLYILLHFANGQLISQQSFTKDALNCPSDLFKCEKSGRCIPMSWKCDQETDCAYGEDEKDCEHRHAACNSDREYHCSEPQDADLAVFGFMHHHCIPKEWMCDGQPDCINKDDEAGCAQTHCKNETHFACKENDGLRPSCIPKSWVCDGQSDCMDMSDEANCTETTEQCKSDEFHCHSGGCIYSSWHCDGEADCADGSDEESCAKHECSAPSQFKCATSDTCLPAGWRCDNEPDCADHSDELDCDPKPTAAPVNCSDKEFKCHNNAQCVSALWVCDGDKDCFDNSDEANCASLTCTPNERMCADGKECVGTESFCDGHVDCSDGSDEHNCPTHATAVECDALTEYACKGTPAKCVKFEELCRTDNCAFSVCDQKIGYCNETVQNCDCRKTQQPGGKICHCKSGFKFSGGKCEDINECETPGVCDQMCTNTFGSYSCGCYPGYLLTVGHSGKFTGGHVPHKCRAIGEDPKLLLSNRATIRQYDIVTNKYHPLISSLESAVALDYWHKNQTLIWSDVSKEQIMICHIGNRTLLNDIGDCVEHGNVTLISKDIRTPDGLAVDWVHGLLFWTDTGFDTINVFDLNTQRRKIIVDQDLDEPRAIAVDPSAGLIFWTDWGVNARIERAGMDGKNRVTIMQGDTVRWPNGLALDVLDQRVYWADAKLKIISSCDYWGNNERVVLHSHRYLRHPFSLAVFEEKLYWTDWDHEGVISVNKFTGNDAKTLVSGMTGPMTVRVYHEQAQPEHPNKCLRHACDHLCLPRSHLTTDSAEDSHLSYSCACDLGYELSGDDHSMCTALGAAAEVISIPPQPVSTSRIPYVYFALLFSVMVVLVLVFTQYRNKTNHFTVLQFDNPIYRRTVEDLDADLENPQDNSLGAISALPVNLEVNGRGGVAFNSKESESGAKLILGSRTNSAASKLGSTQSKISANNGLPTVDVTDSSQYSFDQPRL